MLLEFLAEIFPRISITVPVFGVKLEASFFFLDFDVDFLFLLVSEKFDLDFARFFSQAYHVTGFVPKLVVDYVIPPAPPFPEEQEQ